MKSYILNQKLHALRSTPDMTLSGLIKKAIEGDTILQSAKISNDVDDIDSTLQELQAMKAELNKMISAAEAELKEAGIIEHE